MPLHNPTTDNTPNGWLIGPASNLVLFIGNERVICALTQRVLQASELLPGLYAMASTQLSQEKPDIAQAFARLMQLASDDAAFAAEEIRNGFSTILSHHAVALWAAVETAVEQTLVGLVRKAPGAHDLIVAHCPALNAEKFKTKTANDAEKALAIWEREIKAPSLDRALQMLAVLGIKVAISPDHRRSLIELSEIRNVLLHKGGFVDSRLLQKCPWLKYKVGDNFPIEEDKLSDYFDAAGKFAIELIGSAAKCEFIYKKPSALTGD